MYSYLIWLTILFNTLFYSGNNESPSKVNSIFENSECSNLYPFDGYYIDLENNNPILIDGIPCVDFKNCSRFSHKFSKINYNSVDIDNKTFTIDKDRNQGIYDINIIENENVVGVIHLPVESPLPKTHDYQISIFNYQGNLIMFMESTYTKDFIICKYDIKGKELNRKVIENTFISLSNPHSNKQHRYLYLKDVIGKDMIFTSLASSSEKSKTVILSLDNFSIKEFNKTANGIIANDEETGLAGFASKKENSFDVFLLNGQKFTFTLDNADLACDFILTENHLYIANFNPNATGSSLYCFDVSANKMKWKADVKQLNIAHSRYSNNVILSIYKNKIIMEGNEAQGSYVQLFNANSGNRLAEYGEFLD